MMTARYSIDPLFPAAAISDYDTNVCPGAKLGHQDLESGIRGSHPISVSIKRQLAKNKLKSPINGPHTKSFWTKSAQLNGTVRAS